MSQKQEKITKVDEKPPKIERPSQFSNDEDMFRITPTDDYWHTISDLKKSLNHSMSHNRFAHIWIVEKEENIGQVLNTNSGIGRVLSPISSNKYNHFYNDNVYVCIYAIRIGSTDEWFYNIHCWVGTNATFDDKDYAMNCCSEFCQYIRRETTHIYLEYSGKESPIFTTFYSPYFMISEGSMKSAINEEIEIQNVERNQKKEKEEEKEGKKNETTNEDEHKFRTRLYQFTVINASVVQNNGCYIQEISSDNELSPNYNYLWDRGDELEIVIGKQSTLSGLTDLYYATERIAKNRNLNINDTKRSFTTNDSEPISVNESSLTLYKINVDRSVQPLKKSFELLSSNEKPVSFEIDGKSILLIDYYENNKHHIMIQSGEQTNLRCSLKQVIEFFDDSAKQFMKEVHNEDSPRQYSYSFTNESSNSVVWKAVYSKFSKKDEN